MRRSSGDQEISLISYGQEIQEVQELLSGVETREEIEEVLRRSGNLLNLLYGQESQEVQELLSGVETRE